MNQQQIETISGVVANLKLISTLYGRNMVTFTLDGKQFKAFDEEASTVQTLNGERIKVEAKRGSYRGKPEYAVVSVKATVDGRPVTVTDIRSNAPVRAASGTCPHCGAQMVGRDFYPGPTEEGFEEMLHDHFGGSVAPEVGKPANNPASETPWRSEEEHQKLNEKMIASWVKSFNDIFLHPDSDLEKKSTSPRLAARGSKTSA